MTLDELMDLVVQYGAARADSAYAARDGDQRESTWRAGVALDALAHIRDEVEGKRDQLRDASNDLLDVRGILSPADGEPVTALPLVPAVAPAVRWLVDELARFSPAVDAGRQLFLHGCGMSVTGDPVQTLCRWCAGKAGDVWLPLFVQAPVGPPPEVNRAGS